MLDMQLTYDVEMFRETFEHEFTYINGFLRNTRRFGDRKALTCTVREKSWSYAELNLDCNKLANALLKDGVNKHDVVMYQLFNCSEYVFLYLVPQKIGAINCPINFRLSPGETAYVIDECKPAVFVYDSDISETVEEALEIAGHKPKRIVLVDYSDKGSNIPGTITFEDYIRDMPDTEPSVEHRPYIYDEVTRLYTSGTTGMPKGVPLNQINEILSAHDVIMHFPLSPLDKTMNMTPWFHRGGLYSGGPNPTLYVGGEVIVLRNFNAETVLDYVQKYSITFLIGVPPVLKMLCDQQVNSSRDISTLKGIVTMGAPLEKEACIRYQDVLTPNIFNGYGTTESFWNTFLRPFDLPQKAGSAGRTCTDDDMAVVKVYNDHLAEPYECVARDNQEVGEVIVWCPGKCSYSYFNNPGQSKKRFYKGWMYTGDLATWDKSEYVTIVSRKDDMLISGGENVFPVQVEEALNENPKVYDSVVVGLRDQKWGQIIVAYVIKSDTSLTAGELNKYCVEHPMLANYKRPRYYKFVEQLPMTATGKKIHYKLARQVEKDMQLGLLEKV
ncbi:AMP-binding protein [Desulfoscipio sp. XC116]|uniref:class I adenylate-forming enzyme family protein n=1 Tax=Desulfoscipio sp. XC116 TaxID=3144975 RepID=UPI00325C2609